MGWLNKIAAGFWGAGFTGWLFFPSGGAAGAHEWPGSLPNRLLLPRCHRFRHRHRSHRLQQVAGAESETLLLSQEPHVVACGWALVATSHLTPIPDWPDGPTLTVGTLVSPQNPPVGTAAASYRALELPVEVGGPQHHGDGPAGRNLPPQL